MTRDGREEEGEVLREHGMMPLVSLMSNPNDYIVTQSLNILCNLVRYGTFLGVAIPRLTPAPDSSREVVQTYLDKTALLEVVTSPNPIVSQLARELKLILGF